MPVDRGNVDDVSGLPRLHMRQRRGDAVEHALDVDVDHAVPLVHLETFERGKRHQARIVQHDVDAAEFAHRGVHQVANLLPVRDICLDRPGLVALCGEFVGQCIDAVTPPSTEHHGGTSLGEMACRSFSQSTARAGDDDDFIFDPLSHDVLPFEIVERSNAAAGERSERGRACKKEGGQKESAPPACDVEKNAACKRPPCNGQLDQSDLDTARRFQFTGD